jgi:hypothetical protein
MGVFRLQATMEDGPGLELAKDQLNDLARRKAELKTQKAEKEAQVCFAKENGRMADTARSKILSFPALWRKGSPTEQKRLLGTIFQFLKPTADSLQIFYWLNGDADSAGPTQSTVMTAKNEKRDVDSGSAPLGSLIQFPLVVPSVGIPAVNSNGVPFELTAGIPYPHDLISIPGLTEQGIISEVVSKYESGHSLLEISKLTGIPRSSVRDILIRAGIFLKSAGKGNKAQPRRQSGQVRWNSPYGFKYECGRLVPHPQEFETLRLMLRWSKEELSFEDISRMLNAQNLRPRSASLWTRFTVRQIIMWHQANPEVILKRDGNVIKIALTLTLIAAMTGQLPRSTTQIRHAQVKLLEESKASKWGALRAC